MTATFLETVQFMRDRVPAWDRYPFHLPMLRDLEDLPLHPKVTYFIGENGSGKSTLLEAIAVAEGFNPEGGSRNFQFATRETHSELWECLRLVRGRNLLKHSDGWFLRAESFYNVATEIDALGVAPGYGVESLHQVSHGESFFALLMDRFRGNGLYLLDEPESALSPKRQLSFLTRLHDLVGLGSQFLIATHSPIVMAYPHATIYEFSPRGIERVNYEDTDHYQITKTFLLRRESMLQELLRQ